MRIDLDNHKKRRRRRPRRRKKKRGQFDAVLVQPQIQAPARRKTTRQQPRSQQMAESRSRRNREATQEPKRTPIPWGSMLRRAPTVLLLLALIAAITYLSIAEEFFVYNAEFVGVHHLDANYLYEVAGIHEQNIFWIKPRSVAARINALHGVKDVQVSCGLFPALVTIQVVEREPELMLRALSQERDWWLDHEGIVLPYHGNPDSPDIVFVIDSSQRKLQEGDRVSPDHLVPSVQQLAAALPGTRVFFYRSDRGLSFTQEQDSGSWPVYVGDSLDLARKIQVVRALNSYFTQESIQPRYVDVRWAEHPVYGGAVGQVTEEGD